MRAPRDSTILGEVYDDGDLFGRAMDGAGEAFFSLAMAVGKFLSRPLDGIAGLRNLPGGVAALIASSPEYLERFKLMTAGEQIQAVSRLTTTLLTMFAGGGAVSAGVTRGLGGMEVTGLSTLRRGRRWRWDGWWFRRARSRRCSPQGRALPSSFSPRRHQPLLRPQGRLAPRARLAKSF